MKRGTRPLRGLIATAAIVPFVSAAAFAADLKVMASGGFTAAYNELAPQFELATGNRITTEFGASMGNAPSSIPNRLRRGEPADVVILASTALEELIKSGMVIPESRVDLVRSRIGVAVRAGAAKPDISSVEALKGALLRAGSIAYSDSASGVYVSTELFEKLGIADQVRGKSKRIEGMVGQAIAHGDAEIGVQQISELLPVEGIQYVSPLPAEVQKVTVFSAGIAVASKEPEAARALIRFLTSPSAASAITKSGLEPVGR